MARLDWAVLCDLAYLDRFDRLCIVGIARELTPPTLPSTLSRLMLVGRLTELARVERVEITVGILTPGGAYLAADSDSDQLRIEMAREYVMVTFTDLPLLEAGIYSFRVQIGDRSAISLDVPVFDTGSHQATAVH